MSINRVSISGNLTRDPELRYTPRGTAHLDFGVAVNDRRRNAQTGEWEDRPNFIDCVVWGKRGEALSHYLLKGSKVAVEGRLRWESWEKDGQRRSKVSVVADEIELMSSRREAPDATAPSGVASQQAPFPAPSAVQAPPADDELDDDIPF